MINRKVHKGLLGVNKSSEPDLYLLQITEYTMDEAMQARAVLNEQQVRDLIERLKALLPQHDMPV